ncbi:histidine phosphatase family (branch 2) protein (macronuclear) [Tetrahymena thermophila SB210]|uniref:Histidine phosphatase family (Branch 2) protein n=1 Tax=Tetrahymena thermophila (strain SB210) TaxID=312017 RepID=Q22XJ0_TETTS|nr:histidine phosphatase family (branch 2) protein [Tetrahymena thermophila SB210]EAR90020.1 histidine phosphatase family (branch 2) protein [Tetrahymena thermophila SB210]|eukprot:XP_001010265.1 histidine phosphatase family (branch 2) protein [Tetrahymena thermophila SB210]
MDSRLQNENELYSVLHGAGIEDRRHLPPVENGRRELVMAHVIFRHGARHSMSEHLLEEKQNHKIKASNKGQLSEVGMRQLYLLGQGIRHDYVYTQNFLSETYDRSEIHVQSSNRTRALESAQCFMFGLYPLGTGKSIPSHIDKNLAQPPNTTQRKTSIDTLDGKHQYPQNKKNSEELSTRSSKKNSDELPKMKKKNSKDSIELNQSLHESSNHSSPKDQPLDGFKGLELEIQQFLRRPSKEEIIISIAENPPNIHDDPQFKNDFSLPEGLYPFPILTLGDHDQVLNAYIPEKTKIISSQLKSNEHLIQEQIQKYSEQIAAISKKLHLKPQSNNNILSVKKLFDIITCQKYLGHDYGVTEDEYKLLIYLKSYNCLCEVYTPQYSWVVTTPYLEFVFDSFEKCLQGTNPHKLIVCSSHNCLILPLLVVFGLMSPEGLKRDFENNENNFERYPPFAANFAFELYKIHSNDPTKPPRYEVSIKYNGTYITLMGQKTINADFNEYLKYIRSKVSNDKNYQIFTGIQKKSPAIGRAAKNKNKQDQKQGYNLQLNLTKTNIFLLGLVVAQSIGLYTMYKLYKNKTV